jgi:hypothetical protein
VHHGETDLKVRGNVIKNNIISVKLKIPNNTREKKLP